MAKFGRIIVKVVLLFALCLRLEAREKTATPPNASVAKSFHDIGSSLRSPSIPYFIANEGQWDNQGQRFVLSGVGAQVIATDNGLDLILQKRENVAKEGIDKLPDLLRRTNGFVSRISEQARLKMRLPGSCSVRPAGIQPSNAIVNFSVGTKSRWREGVAAYGGIQYPGVYDGIDFIANAQEDGLKYEFYVSPGADPATIRIRMEGAKSLKILSTGELEIGTPLGVLREKPPLVYQPMEDHRRVILSEFTLLSTDEYAIQLLSLFDPKIPLVIDPQLTWSTVIGGSGGESAVSITTDTHDNVYVGGVTDSTNFPVTSGLDGDPADSATDGFVASFSPAGTLRWATYFGGDEDDDEVQIDIDEEGTENFIYAAWRREQVSETADQPKWCMIQEFSTSTGEATYDPGIVQYTPSDGGDGLEESYFIVVKGDYIYTVGTTGSEGIPTESPWDPAGPYASWLSYAYVKKTPIDQSPPSFGLFTYYHHEHHDYETGVPAHAHISTPYGLAVRNVTGSHTLYVPVFSYGWSHSLQDYEAKSSIVRFDEDLQLLGPASGLALECDEDIPDAPGIEDMVATSSTLYVTGYYNNNLFSDMETGEDVEEGYQSAYGGGTDAYIMRINLLTDAQLSDRKATYFGKASAEHGYALEYLPSSHELVVVGDSASTNLMEDVPALDDSMNGAVDPFVSVFSEDLENLRFSTFLGGDGNDLIYDVAANTRDIVYLGGVVNQNSPGFPLYSRLGSSYDTTISGNDAFVVQMDTRHLDDQMQELALVTPSMTASDWTFSTAGGYAAATDLVETGPDELGIYTPAAISSGVGDYGRWETKAVPSTSMGVIPYVAGDVIYKAKFHLRTTQANNSLVPTFRLGANQYGNCVQTMNIFYSPDNGGTPSNNAHLPSTGRDYYLLFENPRTAPNFHKLDVKWLGGYDWRTWSLTFDVQDKDNSDTGNVYMSDVEVQVIPRPTDETPDVTMDDVVTNFSLTNAFNVQADADEPEEGDVTLHDLGVDGGHSTTYGLWEKDAKSTPYITWPTIQNNIPVLNRMKAEVSAPTTSDRNNFHSLRLRLYSDWGHVASEYRVNGFYPNVDLPCAPAARDWGAPDPTSTIYTHYWMLPDPGNLANLEALYFPTLSFTKFDFSFDLLNQIHDDWEDEETHLTLHGVDIEQIELP